MQVLKQLQLRTGILVPALYCLLFQHRTKWNLKQAIIMAGLGLQSAADINQ